MRHKISVKIRTSSLRMMRRMTQQQLANKTHLSKTTISNLESGHQTKIELETIAKLCDGLDCTPSDLFELVEDKNHKMIQKQRKALAPFIGSLEYDVSFDHKKLDRDLAKIIDKKKRIGKKDDHR